MFKVLLTITILVFLLSALWVIRLTADEQKKWDQFKEAHNCKITEQHEATIGYGYGMTMSGKAGYGAIVTPHRVTWICDNGVKYTR